MTGVIHLSMTANLIKRRMQTDLFHPRGYKLHHFLYFFISKKSCLPNQHCNDHRGFSALVLIKCNDIVPLSGGAHDIANDRRGIEEMTSR